jgi:hypothetical protein
MLETVLVLEPEDLPADQSQVSRASSLRRNLTISWVVGIVAFTLVRLYFAQQWLAPEGLNIWVFGIIDLVTAVPYAIGVAKVVTSMVDHKHKAASGWAAVAAFNFLAPYLYVAWSGEQHSYPAPIWWVLGALVSVFGINAVLGVSRRVREQRKLRLVTSSAT